MAYGLKKISPIDLRPSTAIGVKLPFSAANVFSSVYTTKDQTKYNLINFLLTNKNERPFSVKFGAGLRSVLFEQISEATTSELEMKVQSEIEENFPNVQVLSLSVTGSPDEHSVTISFKYRLKRTNENDNVTIKIQNA